MRFSEAVLDVRMQNSEAGPSRVAGVQLLKALQSQSPRSPVRGCSACPLLLMCLVVCYTLPEEVCHGAELATASGLVQANVFVIAAGLRTPELARMAGVEVPLDDKPATLNVYTLPAPPLLQHMLLSGGFLSYQAAPSLGRDISQGEAMQMTVTIILLVWTATYNI